MTRRFVISLAALLGLVAGTAYADTRPPAITQQSAPALHLMNDREFGVFLERLDTDMLTSRGQLRIFEVKSLGEDIQTSQELEKSQNRCLQSLENIREDIQFLSQKQTLKFDLLLLIDLNQMARNLEALDQELMNLDPAVGSGTTRKSLDYAREITRIDATLAPRITAFQDHILAFSGVIDAALEQPDQPGESIQPPTAK